MKKLTIAFLVMVALLAVAPASAATITGLCNTGFGDVGCLTLQTEGSTDGNYVLTTNPQGPAGNATVVISTGFPLPDAWMANTSLSQWIGPAGDQSAGCCMGGEYIYQLLFNVVSGGPVDITGGWATDNDATIWLDGVNTGFTSSSFASFTPFNLIGVTDGPHTLEFRVDNAGGPTGLRVEFDATSVPEPSTLALLGAGLVALGVIRRRKA